MTKKNGKKRARSGIYSGNSEENFLDLMCQHFLLRRAEWTAYYIAIKEKKFKATYKALTRLTKLLEQKVEILIRFGKLVPPSKKSRK